MTREHEAADLFARRKAEHVMRALVTNLRTASSLPYLVSHEHQPMRGVPAFIVGAGPSLSASLPLLERAAEVGYVIAVNASAQAVSRVVQPDVVVVRESIDVSAQMQGVRAGLVALDACASPAVWAAAESVGERGWFLAGAVQHFGIASLLRARPVYAGPAALTAAVALAHAWGASPIVLVGCNLAFAGDGRGYAAESGWGDVRGHVHGGHVSLAGMAHMRGVVAASGQTPPPEVQQVERFPAWGGEGEVSSLLTWGDQVRWLRDFAARRPKSGGEFFNATGAGARIDGWWEQTLADAVHYYSRERRPYTPREKAATGPHLTPPEAFLRECPRIDTQPALDALAADAAHAVEVADGQAPPRLTCGVLEAMSASGILAARDEARGDARKAILGSWEAYAKSGRWVLSNA